MDKSEVVKVKVFTLEGKIVYDDKVMRAAGQHNTKINTADLASGSYYYAISTEKVQMTSKFVVTK